MKELLALGLLLLGGCSIASREVRVLSSSEKITVYRLQVDEGDAVVCDNERCRVVK